MRKLSRALDLVQESLKDYIDMFYDEQLMLWLHVFKERLDVRDLLSTEHCNVMLILICARRKRSISGLEKVNCMLRSENNRSLKELRVREALSHDR